MVAFDLNLNNLFPTKETQSLIASSSHKKIEESCVHKKNTLIDSLNHTSAFPPPSGFTLGFTSSSDIAQQSTATKGCSINWPVLAQRLGNCTSDYLNWELEYRLKGSVRWARLRVNSQWWSYKLVPAGAGGPRRLRRRMSESPPPWPSPWRSSAKSWLEPPRCSDL